MLEVKRVRIARWAAVGARARPQRLTDDFARVGQLLAPVFAQQLDTRR